LCVVINLSFLDLEKPWMLELGPQLCICGTLIGKKCWRFPKKYVDIYMSGLGKV
jgi:hypothetical protein